MESKEDILNRNYYLARVVTDGRVNNTEAIHKAMDEYAQQMAVLFADFCISNTTSVGFECEYWIYNNKRHTTAELYQIFLNEKQK